MGNEIEMQNQVIHELGDAIDHTTDTIRHDRTTLQRHSRKQRITHCGAYLFFTILILIVIIVILNILRNAFRSALSSTNKPMHTPNKSMHTPNKLLHIQQTSLCTHQTSFCTYNKQAYAHTPNAISAAPIDDPSSAKPMSMSFLPSSSSASRTQFW